MTMIQVKNIHYYELSGKPNVEIIGITVSMWKQNIFDTILTSNDLLNVQGAIRKVFGSI